MANTYPAGQEFRVRGTFKNEAGVATDPDTVTLQVKDSVTGTITTFTHPASVTKEGTGVYSKVVSSDEPGRLYYRFLGTGAVKAADWKYALIEQHPFEQPADVA